LFFLFCCLVVWFYCLLDFLNFISFQSIPKSLTFFLMN
jgi:hypothetical protein